MKSDPNLSSCSMWYFIFLFSKQQLPAASCPHRPAAPPPWGPFLSLSLTYTGRSSGSFHNPGVRVGMECVWDTKRQQNLLLTLRFVEPPLLHPPRSSRGDAIRQQAGLSTLSPQTSGRAWQTLHARGSPNARGSPAFCAGTGAAPAEPSRSTCFIDHGARSAAPHLHDSF